MSNRAGNFRLAVIDRDQYEIGTMEQGITRREASARARELAGEDRGYWVWKWESQTLPDEIDRIAVIRQTDNEEVEAFVPDFQCNHNYP